MTGNLDVDGHKLVNLEDPASYSDAANKKYVDSQLHESQVQPSHYKDQFSYLMYSTSQWTDEIDNRNSFYPKLDILLPREGNFHDYNFRVINMSIIYRFIQG